MKKGLRVGLLFLVHLQHLEKGLPVLKAERECLEQLQPNEIIKSK